MSILEEKLNHNINELQRFIHNSRRQALFSQSTRKRSKQPLSQYYSLLESNKQLS